MKNTELNAIIAAVLAGVCDELESTAQAVLDDVATSRAVLAATIANLGPKQD